MKINFASIKEAICGVAKLVDKRGKYDGEQEQGDENLNAPMDEQPVGQDLVSHGENMADATVSQAIGGDQKLDPWQWKSEAREALFDWFQEDTVHSDKTSEFKDLNSDEEQASELTIDEVSCCSENPAEHDPIEPVTVIQEEVSAEEKNVLENMVLAQEENINGSDRECTGDLTKEEENCDREGQEYEYVMPDVELLEKSKRKKINVKELEKERRLITDILGRCSSGLTLKDVVEAPRFRVYKYNFLAGTRLRTVKCFESELERMLGKSPIKIEAVAGEAGTIGVYIPKKDLTPVSLADIIEKCIDDEGKIYIPIGELETGEPIIEDLKDIKHLLIGGTTGTGKSVFLHTIITSLLYQFSPEQLRMIMIDTNLIELSDYNGLPHMYVPVITDPAKARSMLQWVEFEVNKRAQKFIGIGAKNLEEFNHMVMEYGQLESFRGETPYPYIVVIIDGLDGVTQKNENEMEEILYQLLRSAASVGIHLIISSQFYSRKVLSERVQAYITNRVAFTTATAEQSRMVLGDNGAEMLLGAGDLLYKKRITTGVCRAQGYFISTDEVSAVVDSIKRSVFVEYDRDLIKEIKISLGEISAYESVVKEPEDELLPDAVEVVFETGQASVSMLQRRLKLGYSRAARLVDKMEERGIVGPFEGSKPRQLLITRSQWQEMRMGIVELEDRGGIG